LATAADITAIVVAAINLLAGALGGWAWHRDESSRTFWLTARAGQFAATAMAGLALVMIVSGYHPGSGLLWLYMILPVAVSIIAEQLRIASAQNVLDANDLEDAQAVGALPEPEQQLIVHAIIRRETGIIALAALVIVFLALRVLGTT
jgi:hypothetical protein